MRYQVYCEEMGFLDKKDYQERQETDEYDKQSIHIVVQVGDKLAGYARVILPNHKDLPIFSHFDIPKEEDPKHACEISRFMIASIYRHKAETRREVFRLLAEEILKVIEEEKIRVVYAIVEEWLLKSLRKRGYNFEQINEGHFHMGAVTLPIKLAVSR
jgi:N-acyl-L-homoserine lactone synthetase